GVDVADAGDDRLVEQRTLDLRAATPHPAYQGVEVEARVQQVARDVRHGRGQHGQIGSVPGGGAGRGGGVAVGHQVLDAEVAERALVDEVEVARARRRTGQVQADAQVRVPPLVVGCGTVAAGCDAGAADEELAGHAEVR